MITNQNYFGGVSLAMIAAVSCLGFITTTWRSPCTEGIFRVFETRTATNLGYERETYTITPYAAIYSADRSQHDANETSFGLAMFTQCNFNNGPMTAIVLAKTHKTAGSTLGAILQRFGIKNNLTFALPRKLNKFGETPFTSDMLVTQPPKDGFHMFINHVPFNKTSIQNVVKSDAKFVTILREPVTHFTSAVSYFKLQNRSGLSGDITSSSFNLSRLLDKVAHCNFSMCQYTYNGQAFDLGQFHNETNLSTAVIAERIELIEKQFDLVLLQDYFDESLIILKKLMCWSFEDIVYRSMKVSNRTNRSKNYSSDRIEMIKKWNYVDVMLYEHFKKVLKRRINQYGPSFDEDLRKFRSIKEKEVQACTDQAQLPTCQNLDKDVNQLTGALIDKENKTLHKLLLHVHKKVKKYRKSIRF